MKRRAFLTYSAAIVSGAGLMTLFNRHQPLPAISSSIDTEKVLLSFFDPEFVQLKQLFPDIKNYSDALIALKKRDMLFQGKIDLTRLDELASTDPIIDFQGWQHLESELLLYLASYLLVEETQCKGECTGNPLSTNESMTIVEGIDFYGQDIKSFKISTNIQQQAIDICAQQCKQTEQCDFFTLAKNNHPIKAKRHVCWLKKEGVQARKGTNYISGIKQNH